MGGGSEICIRSGEKLGAALWNREGERGCMAGMPLADLIYIIAFGRFVFELENSMDDAGLSSHTDTKLGHVPSLFAHTSARTPHPSLKDKAVAVP